MRQVGPGCPERGGGIESAVFPLWDRSRRELLTPGPLPDREAQFWPPVSFKSLQYRNTAIMQYCNNAITYQRRGNSRKETTSARNHILFSCSGPDLAIVGAPPLQEQEQEQLQLPDREQITLCSGLEQERDIYPSNTLL